MDRSDVSDSIFIVSKQVRTSFLGLCCSSGIMYFDTNPVICCSGICEDYGVLEIRCVKKIFSKSLMIYRTNFWLSCL